MSVMNMNKLSAQIRSIKGNAHKLRDQIQEALISCAYHAAKDGQVTPFNNLLDAVQGTARVKGITMWGELYGFVRVKDEKFVVNKSARSEAGVTDEESFADFEAEMRQGPKWYEIAGAEPVQSMFDPSAYGASVFKRLNDKGYIGLAERIKDVFDEFNRELVLEKLEAESRETADVE